MQRIFKASVLFEIAEEDANRNIANYCLKTINNFPPEEYSSYSIYLIGLMTVVLKFDLLPFAWLSLRHSPGHKAGIDIDHGQDGTGLEHGIESRLPSVSQAVAGGNRQACDQRFHQPGHHCR